MFFNHPAPLQSHDALRRQIVGIDQQVPLLDGSWKTYVNLDNAASTPALEFVVSKLQEATQWYASVHRGTGFKSIRTTHMYEESRHLLCRFIGADPESESLVFVKNTTEAVNILARRMRFQPDDIVLTTLMEHHSNDLPWRQAARVIYAGVNRDGSLDLDDFRSKLKQNASRIKLVAVTGASNVTGFLPPIYDLAEMAHLSGIPIFVDCAQLFPHRRIHKGAQGDGKYLDFIAFSGHKVYAPFGGGALVGPKAFFNHSDPDYRGGGTIEIVTTKEVFWADSPDRDEPGSPNVIGAVTLAASAAQLSSYGMDKLEAHEAELTSYLLKKLRDIPEVRVFGSADPQRTGDRLGVVTFSLGDIPHAKVAAIFGFEGGIGVRNGCYCAHPYVIRLMGIGEDEFNIFKKQALKGDRSTLPGMVRASFGCYNNPQDVDEMITMIRRILAGDYRGEYVVDKISGSYRPKDLDIDRFLIKKQPDQE